MVRRSAVRQARFKVVSAGHESAPGWCTSQHGTAIVCGRYALFAAPEELARIFGLPLDEVERVFVPRPRFNVAPAETVLAVRSRAARGGTEAVGLKWGLIPHWARGSEFRARTINARAETAARKPVFRDSFRLRRCLVPASAFYEWKKLPSGKQPYLFQLEGSQPFAFAGLWDRWVGSDSEVVESCAIVTTRPNPLTRQVHDRMPVIVDPQDYDTWLDPELRDPHHFDKILGPYPASRMTGYPVSTAVSRPGNDAHEMVRQVGDALSVPPELDLGLDR